MKRADKTRQRRTQKRREKGRLRKQTKEHIKTYTKDRKPRTFDRNPGLEELARDLGLTEWG